TSGGRTFTKKWSRPASSRTASTTRRATRFSSSTRGSGSTCGPRTNGAEVKERSASEPRLFLRRGQGVVDVRRQHRGHGDRHVLPRFVIDHIVVDRRQAPQERRDGEGVLVGEIGEGRIGHNRG